MLSSFTLLSDGKTSTSGVLAQIGSFGQGALIA